MSSEKCEDSNQFVYVDEQMYQVESILKKRVIHGVTQYLVKWRGWDDAGDSTWEPVDNLSNVKDLIKEFQDRRNEKSKKNERSEIHQDAAMEVEQKETKKRKLIKESQKIRQQKQKQKVERTPSKKKSRNQVSIQSSQDIKIVRTSKEKSKSKMKRRNMSQSSNSSSSKSSKRSKKREGSKSKSSLNIGRVNAMFVKPNNEIFYEVNIINSKKQCIGVQLRSSQELKKKENRQLLISYLERFLQDEERSKQLFMEA